MAVDAGKQKGAQQIELAPHVVGEGDHRGRGMTHIGGRVWSERAEPPLGLGHGVYDHGADQAADRLVEDRVPSMPG